MVSIQLLSELELALTCPKLRARVEPSEAVELIELLRRGALTHDDPDEPPTIRSRDRGDDYLIALAATAPAVIVSGDGHLLELAGQLPIFSPAEFLAELERRP